MCWPLLKVIFNNANIIISIRINIRCSCRPNLGTTRMSTSIWIRLIIIMRLMKFNMGT